MREKNRSIDYPFLGAMGGIGLMVGLACLLVGVAVGVTMTGFYLAAGSLLVAAVVMGWVLCRDREPEGISLLPTIPERPQVLTTLDGVLVHCNDAYRHFVKQTLKRDDIFPPLAAVARAEVAEFKTRLSGMAPGEEESHVIAFFSGNRDIKYTTVQISRPVERQDYIVWTLSGVTSEARANIAAQTVQEKQPQQVPDFSLEHLGILLDRSDCGLMVISEDGQIIYGNDMLCHWLTGKSDQTLSLPMALRDFWPDFAAHMKASQPLLATQIQGKMRFKDLAGEDIFLEFMPFETILGTRETNAIQESNHSGLLFFQVFSTVSDLYHPVAQTENINFDRFFRESPIGIAIVTEEGQLLEKNHILRDYIQALAIQNSRSLKHIIAADDYEALHEKIKTTLTTGQASAMADINFKGTGDRHAQIYITRLHEFAGHNQVGILYLIDSTEQKNLELQFAQSQKMQAVGQLAGGIAHDFNNLLTAIIGFSDLLLVRHGPGDQSFSDISQIKQNANRAANLVRQLLAFSRQQTLRPKVLVLTDVLAELSNLLGRLMGDGIELEMNHGRNLGQVKVDQGQIEQVIINLCVNARDAMDNQGKISIRTRNVSQEESKVIHKRYQVMPPDEYILLEVEDTGCGIAKEHLGKIFEPFFSTKEVGKGTGLGLSTVYGIVKQTAGFVFPSSEVGKGTTFSIYLPLYKSAPEEQETDEKPVDAEPEKVSRDLTGKGTILLVEDEDAVRMFAARALKNKGYNVYEANSGEAALTLFHDIEDSLDLLISDVVMPLMDGPTLVRHIRETNSRLKVIFISGYAEDAFDKTPGEGTFHFLPKPFSLKQLAEEVKEVLES